jgi:hypothetical protein
VKLLYRNLLICISIVAPVLNSSAQRRLHAHNGRGFEIEVVAGKLQAQGINAAEPDGAPAVRPYINSIHDHWRTIQSLDSSIASLPEFEVGPQVAFAFLESYALELRLVSALQWASPPLTPSTGTVPSLTPLENADVISIQTLSSPITTESLGTLQLSTSVPAGGTGDIIPLFRVDGSPTDRIHVLEFVLSAIAPDATHPAIASSDSLFVLLSPDGVGPAERLHHASLYLEQHLAIHGLPIPEPTSLVLLAWGVFWLSHSWASRPCVESARD